MDEERSDPEDEPRVETVSFPFDRMTVARFRETFPRARWSETLQAWRVPGRTARRRIDRWLATEADRRQPYEAERGRDAYAFEPILSPYLQVHDQGFSIRTPYSRTIVEALRQVPFARWNGEDKVWDVPFSSYDELRLLWETIEEAARRNEPDERRKRAEAKRGTEAEAQARRRAAERRRRRLAVPSDDLPPLERPVATTAYGIVVILDVTGELVEPSLPIEQRPETDGDLAWAQWRPPSLEELIHTWPARNEPSPGERQRGWWLPTLTELREARRVAKSRERRHG